MDDASPRNTAVPWIERILAAAAVLICLADDVFVWQEISLQQPVWPLPGLYLVEIWLVSVAGAYGIYRASLDDGRFFWLAWGASGMVLGFALVSAWSIGLFFLPVWALLLAAGVISARRRRTPVLGLFTLSLVAALLQGGLILWVASQVFRMS
jgi:hypothetical protein